MIFDLRSYRDLGRCSYATLKECFDTGKDHIHLGVEEVTITRVEDLFPFLWRPVSASVRNGDVTHAHFSRQSPDSHWHADYDPSIAMDEAEAAKLERKLAKDPGNRNAARWKSRMEYYRTTSDGLRKLVARLDAERTGIEQQILRDNDAG